MTFRNSLAVGSALLMATALPGLAAGLDAELSASRIAEGDQVMLRLSADGSAGAGQPDLSVLEQDFEVLGTASGRQTTIINGARSDRVTWQVTLAPKHEGDLTVPAITAGPISSAPMTLQVVDAGALPAAAQAGRPTLTVTPPEGALYAQQEIPLTVQLRLPAGTREAQVIAPSGSNFLLEQSGEDQATRQPDGSTLVERHYLLRPQKDGSLQLGGFALRAEVADPDAPGPFAGMDRAPFGRSPFANSMFDDFFNDSMFASTRTVSITSEPITLDVQPTPGSASGWVLPATAVELRSDWQPDPPQFKVGEAVTRKVQVLALGAHGEQIPDLAMPEIPGAKVYFEGAESRSVPTDKGTAALREFTWSIVPTSGGKITLPELTVEWFDTKAKAPAKAVLAAETFSVEGPVAPAAPAPAAVAPAPAPAAAHAALPDRSMTGWLAAGFVALVAGLTAILVLARRIRLQRRPAASPRPEAAPQVDRRKDALARAATAARASDQAMMHRAILDWGRAAALGPDTVALRFPDLGRGVQQLEAVLFGQAGEQPDVPALLAALRAADRTLDAKAGRTVLPPLYPETA